MKKHVMMEDVLDLNGGDVEKEIEVKVAEFTEAYFHNRHQASHLAEKPKISSRGLFATWIWVFRREFLTTCLLTLGKSVCIFSTPFII